MTFLGVATCAAEAAALLKITRRLTSPYGNHLSTMTFCGFDGSGASLSITTFRGGGGRRLPPIVILFGPTGCGGYGGASRTTIGSGVAARAGC